NGNAHSSPHTASTRHRGLVRPLNDTLAGCHVPDRDAWLLVPNRCEMFAFAKRSRSRSFRSRRLRPSALSHNGRRASRGERKCFPLARVVVSRELNAHAALIETSRVLVARCLYRRGFRQGLAPFSPELPPLRRARCRSRYPHESRCSP